jgi:hypothetical protein
MKREIKLKGDFNELKNKMTSHDKELRDEKDKVMKYYLENSQMKKLLKDSREIADEERERKELLRDDLDKLIAETQGKYSQGMGYSDMSQKIVELKKDIYLLEAQKQVLIYVNPSSGAFEYVGEPLPLNNEKELKDFD